MDANPGRTTFHASDDPIEPDHDQPDAGIDDSDDPDLEAWLVARETELDEMAWALADQYRDEVGK